KDHIKSQYGSSHRPPFGHTQDLPQRPLHPQQTQERFFQLDSNSPYQRPGMASSMHAHARDPQDRFTAEKRPEPPYATSARPNISQVPEAIRQPTQPVPTPSTQPVSSAPPKEPSRRVNIMSMLNPEPGEDRPRKKEP